MNNEVWVKEEGEIKEILSIIFLKDKLKKKFLKKKKHYEE